jgi:hypothetical protein
MLNAQDGDVESAKGLPLRHYRRLAAPVQACQHQRIVCDGAPAPNRRRSGGTTAKRAACHGFCTLAQTAAHDRPGIKGGHVKRRRS